MEMTFSRQFLDVAGILDYLVGALALIVSILITAAGAVVMNNPELAAEMPSTFGSCTVLIIGIAIAAGSIFTILYGYLERAAAKDPAKIMPVWVLSLLSVILGAGSIIFDFVKHVDLADMNSSFISLAFSILIFIFANNTKKEAGK